MYRQRGAAARGARRSRPRPLSATTNQPHDKSVEQKAGPSATSTTRCPGRIAAADHDRCDHGGKAMSLRRPRGWPSLPRTLAAVPIRPRTVTTNVGESRVSAGAGAQRDVTREKPRPSPAALHLQRVDTVGERVGHGGAIAQHGGEIEKPRSVAGWRRRLFAARHRERRDRPRGARTQRPREKRSAIRRDRRADPRTGGGGARPCRRTVRRRRRCSGGVPLSPRAT